MIAPANDARLTRESNIYAGEEKGSPETAVARNTWRFPRYLWDVFRELDIPFQQTSTAPDTVDQVVANTPFLAKLAS